MAPPIKRAPAHCPCACPFNTTHTKLDMLMPSGTMRTRLTLQLPSRRHQKRIPYGCASHRDSLAALAVARLLDAMV